MILPMSVEDLEEVVDIENSVFTYPYTKEAYRYEIEDSIVANLYIYKENERILGYIDYWVTFDSCQLCKIAIHPAFQRQGIGEKLMEFMFENLPNDVEHVFLEVRERNTKAQAFYEKLGFIQIDTRKDYYKDPKEDAIIMGVALVGE